MKAIWNGVVVAESDDVLMIEKDYYFPLASLKPQYLRLSITQDEMANIASITTFNLKLGRRQCVDAVWYYDNPKSAAKGAYGRVAFRKEVQIKQ